MKKILFLFLIVFCCLTTVNATDNISNDTFEIDESQDILSVDEIVDIYVNDDSQDVLYSGESEENPVTDANQLWNKFYRMPESSTGNIYIADGIYDCYKTFSWPVNVTFIGQSENTILKGISTMAGPGVTANGINYEIQYTFVNLTFIGGTNDLARGCKFINCTIVDSLTFTKYFYDNPDDLDIRRLTQNHYALRTYLYEFDNCVFKNYNGNDSYLTLYQYSRVSFNNCSFTNISADSIACYNSNVSYEKIRNYLLKLGWDLSEIERVSHDGIYLTNCSFNDSRYVAITDAYASVSRNVTDCKDVRSDYYGIFPSQVGLHQYYSLPIPAGTTLTVTMDDIVYGDSFVIHVDFNNHVCDDVVAVINKNKYTVKVINGTGSLKVSDIFDCGVLNVKSNSQYNGFNSTSNFTVNKANTKFNAPSINSAFNEGKYLIITLKDYKNRFLANALVKVKIGFAVFEVYTQSNGQAKVALNNLIPKTYSVIANYNGDKNHFNSTVEFKVIISKATPKLTAKKAIFKVKTKNKKYFIVLKTNKNKPLSKVKVTLKVKGKIYKATTNVKGKATFKITKLTKKGTFKSTVRFSGNACYKALTKKVNIKVK